MSVIIRLQNLAWSANALDIRRLFHGLCIPDGGVHIVGGENGDAFIAFSTDEDARKAMHMDGALLLQNPIKLYLSSKNEMQNVIAIARGSQSAEQPNGAPQRNNMGAQGFNQGPDRGFNDRNQLPPPQMGFQAPPGPQASGPFGRTPDREEHFDEGDRGYGRPGMNGPPNHRPPPFDRGQEPMVRAGGPGGREDFLQEDFLPQQPPPMERMHGPPPRGMEETRVVNRGHQGRNFGPDMDARPPKQGILGDSPMGFGPLDEGPPRKILLADPVPDHGPILAGNFPPEGMMGMPEDHFMGRPHDHGRDRWEPNGQEEFRGRRERGERHSRFDNADRRRFEEERHAGPRDRSPLRRDYGRDRRPVQPFGAGADEHNVFVYVQNMPTNISYRDVRRFFSGCPIPSTGLKMINDQHGRRTGEAYVMFSSEQVTADALKKDGESMTGLEVRVGPSTKEDFDAAVDSFVPSRPPRREASPPSRPSRAEPSRNGGEYFVEIRNIPFRAVRAEIKQFFAKLHITPGGGPVMDTGSDGRFNGVIFLQLQDHRDLRNALDMNGGNFMGRSIEVVEVRRGTFEGKVEKERNKGRERDQGKEEGRDRGGRDDKEKERDADKKGGDAETKSAKGKSERNPPEKFYCVKLDGLPYLANNVAVKDFFEGLEIAQRGIHLMHNDRHQCTGIGYVEFVTSADCDKAVAKNKEYMGKRFILVEAITKRDMLDSMAKDRSDARPRGSADRGRGRGRGMSSGGRGGSNEGYGHERQERTSRFTSERSFDPQGFNSGGEMYDERRVEREFERRDYNRPEANYSGMDDLAMDNAVVVAMYNVPYRASSLDIVDFFQGFPVDPHSVQLLQTADGRRTGEVNVTFPSVEDAAMAVQQLDHQDFMGRAVELCIL